MKRVAVLKPDHLGDLVLSVPAIRTIRSRSDHLALFVAPSSITLARYLFPEADEIHPIAFAHLSRRPVAGIPAADAARAMAQFDFLFVLRDDPVMREMLSFLRTDHVVASGGHLTHESAIQKRAVSSVFGEYSRTRAMGEVPIFWTGVPRHVALCIAAGFPTNRWPIAYWHELAALLSVRGVRLTLVGGPGERDELRMLSRLLAPIEHGILVGDDDFGGFFDRLDGVDLVVATDGGTAHLCSLRKPVCSIFGSSPWRRYAPFGRDNVLLTRDEPCSPCVQFSDHELNGCVTRECLARLRPEHVLGVVLSDGIDFPRSGAFRTERGVSHRYVD